ncbi:MAG: hypothetical protein IPL61_37155 [Myxococcales bacterium]|nr:hypothetical protein [Myxococcales bacterium]
MLVALASPTLAAAQPSPLAPGEVERQIALADHLHARGEFYREIGELERLEVLAPTPAVAGWARLRIAIAYHRGGQFADAVAAYDRARVGSAPEVVPLVAVQRALALAEQSLHEPDRPRTADALGELEPLLGFPAAAGFHAAIARARLAAVVGDRALVERSLEQAQDRCRAIDDAACIAAAGVAAALRLPRPAHRSPTVAVGLSLIAPGVGSGYAGHYVDGLYYLGLTSLAAAGAYDVYQPEHALGDQRAAFWGLATLAGTFYLSNLVNAYLAARRWNQVEDHRWRDRMWRASELGLPLEALAAP